MRYSFTHLLIPPLTHSLIHSLPQIDDESMGYCLIHSLTHSPLTHLLIHSLTYFTSFLSIFQEIQQLPSYYFNVIHDGFVLYEAKSFSNHEKSFRL